MKFGIAVLLLAATTLLSTPRTTWSQNNDWSGPPGAPADWNGGGNWTSNFGANVPSAEFDESAVIANGGIAVVGDAVPDVVDLTVSNGTVRIESDGSLGVVGDLNVGANGLLHLTDNATLRVEGNARNAARITGPSVDYQISGDYTTTDRLIAEITGDNHSPVQVGGTAVLGGTLQVELNGVTPQFGDSWALINAANVSGRFTSAIGSNLPSGLRYQVTQDQGNVTVGIGNTLVLSIDRRTGAGQIENPVGGAVELKGYSIDSAGGLLSAETWSSFMDSGAAGVSWEEANPQDTHLSELNLISSTSLDVGGSLPVGNPYVPGPQRPEQEDVVFEYLTADGEFVQGAVAYTGPPNDLVLNVDPDTGAGAISNLSPFIEPPDVKAYSINSDSGALTPDTWNSFQDGGGAGGGWEEANPQSRHLSELNLTSSTLFTNNTLVELGQLFQPGSSRDLVFEYLTDGGEVRLGTVQYGEIPGVVDGLRGDFNADSVVDLADVDLLAGEIAAGTNQAVFDLNNDDVVDVIDLSVFLSEDVITDGNKLNGDADFSGGVEFPDFLILSGSFGQDGKRWSEGDFDASGGVGFPDFLILSSNFGQSAVAAAAAVPEPSGALLAGMALSALLRRRHRRNS